MIEGSSAAPRSAPRFAPLAAVLLAGAAVVVSAAGLLAWMHATYSRHAREWSRVELGMTREEVAAVLGPASRRGTFADLETDWEHRDESGSRAEVVEVVEWRSFVAFNQVRAVGFDREGRARSKLRGTN